jgi:hypothetical protein
VVAAHQRQVAGDPAQHRVLVHVRLLAGGPEHLGAGDQQEHAEDVQDPVELGDQRRADEDHDRAQHDRAQHAQDEHALLALRRHREVGEQHQEHEDVVDRQRFLDQVAGQELHADAVAGLGPELIAGVPPQPQIEGQRQRHPAHAPPGGFLERDLVRAAMAHEHQVDQQGHGHNDGECRPQQRGTDRLHAHSTG